jgi:hypothetical protein
MMKFIRNAVFSFVLLTVAIAGGEVSAKAETETVASAAVSQSFTTTGSVMTTAQKVEAFSISSTTAVKEKCWQIILVKRVVNKLNNTMFYPMLFSQWCGYNGKVTRTPTTASCHNIGGFYTYKGCTRGRGGLGFSSLTQWGDWNYYLGPFYGVSINGGANLMAKFYPDGRVAGTWTWFPAS